MTTIVNPVGVQELRMSVRIEASQEEVWRLLTSEMGEWWPRSFHMGGDQSAMRLELQPGGRMFEEWGKNEGLLWGTVCHLVAPETLRVVADTFPGFGGPARAYLTWQLEADGEGTKVTFADSSVERIEGDQAAGREQGWKYLLACLAAKAEGRPEPAWTD